MNQNKWIQTFAALLATAALTTSAMAQDIYALRISGVGKIQDSRTIFFNCFTEEGERSCEAAEVNTINTVAINNNVLINLALGQPIKNKVPTNKVLGLLLAGEGGQIVLFDTANPSATPVVVAELTVSNTINKGKLQCLGAGEERSCGPVNTAFETLVGVSFSAVGNPGVNSIDAGQINGHAKGSYDTDGNPSKVIANGTGTLDVTNTFQEKDSETGELVDVTESNHVLVQKMTFSTGKKLTTLVL